MDIDVPYFDDNTLHYHGRSVLLRPHTLKVAKMLLDRMPMVVRFDELVALWKDKGTYCTRGTLRTYTCNLRTQLAPLGLSLLVIRGAGYKLVSQKLKSYDANGACIGVSL